MGLFFWWWIWYQIRSWYFAAVPSNRISKRTESSGHCLCTGRWITFKSLKNVRCLRWPGKHTHTHTTHFGWGDWCLNYWDHNPLEKAFTGRVWLRDSSTTVLLTPVACCSWWRRSTLFCDVCIDGFRFNPRECTDIQIADFTIWVQITVPYFEIPIRYCKI